VIDKAFKYRIPGAKDTDLLDLKRIFERVFIKNEKDDLADEIGLAAMSEIVVHG
jgi:hypothetical protein